MLRRALTAKKFALMRLQHALQDFSALRGLGIGHANAGHVEALLRVPRGVFVVQAQAPIAK